MQAAESVKPSKPGDKTENKFGKKLETKEKVDLKDGGDDVMEQSLEKMVVHDFCCNLSEFF